MIKHTCKLGQHCLYMYSGLLHFSHIQFFSKTVARYNIWPFKTLPRLQLKNRFRKNPVKKKKKKKALQLRKPY